MGSEILSSNCYYNNFSAAGIYVGEANALQITVVGGNISQCAKGIYCQNGSMSTILGVSFQLNTTMDIHIQGGIQDGWIIAGCRSESTNFLESQPDSFVSVIGCTQTSSADGYFLNNCGSKMTVISCHSVNGKVHGSSSLNVIGSKFDRSDWNAWFGSIGGELSVAPYVTRTANLALTSAMSGTIFDNIGASAEVDFTLPTDSNAGRLPPGTWYGFYVAAAQILKIKTGTGANIRIAASTSTTTTGDIHASTIGNYVELMCTADGGSTWVARSTIGTWTIV
jgi:hypothetical protein